MSQYCIYQLPVEKEYTFRSWKEAKAHFNFSDYKQVYKGELVDAVQYGVKSTLCNKVKCFPSMASIGILDNLQSKSQCF